MAFEGNPSAPKREAGHEWHEQTPRRLMTMLEVPLAAVGKISVEGMEKLEGLDPEKQYIIATTHHSDLDMPIVVKALGDRFDLAVTNQSIHHSLKGEWNMYLSLKAAGQENFIPIDWQKKDGKKVPGRFNPENYIPMVEALKKGKRIVMAAENPHPEEGALERGEAGHGATYLAQISGATIIPVAVRLTDRELGMDKNTVKTLLHRPDAIVTIGEPYTPEQVPSITALADVIENKHYDGDRMASFKAGRADLERESEVLAKRLAALAPSDAPRAEDGGR